MSLIASLEAAILAAAREQDRMRVTVLRSLKSELHNAAIAKQSELSEEEVTASLQKEVKKREESAALYRKHGAEERAVQEESEAALIRTLLPAEPGIEELVAVLTDRYGSATELPNQGMLIGEIKREFGARLSGARAAQAVAQFLASR